MAEIKSISNISVVILTYNEELNLENCLKGVSNWVSEIFVVDSFSTDKTLGIAKKYGAEIVQHPFENQAQQFNWALDNLKIKNDWILRLDADEYLTPELKDEIAQALTDADLTQTNAENSRYNSANSASGLRNSADVNGFYIKRRVYFMGRWIKHGSYYPVWFLRLFKKGKARSEQRAMDEHIVLLEGKAEKLKNDFIDDNKKPLADWIAKHNNYSSREAEEGLKLATCQKLNLSVQLTGQAKRKRWVKEKFYYRLPIFCRAFLYFIYRYFFRLGFLDGKEGLIFHFLQGCWYRFLVDSKIYELKRKLTKKNF